MKRAGPSQLGASRPGDTSRVLGVGALAAADDAVRLRCLDEGEAILARGCNAHNHLWFHHDAIEASLAARDWGEAERYASLLEGYLVEPWPHCEMLIERGRLLAAYGRGRRDPELGARIEEMQEDCRALGLWAPAFEWVLGKKEVAM